MPGAGAWLGAWLAAGAEAEVAGELGFAGGGAALPPGTAVGTVEGWSWVFQVGAVGQAVVATEGEGSAKGAGPGTMRVLALAIQEQK